MRGGICVTEGMFGEKLSVAELAILNNSSYRRTALMLSLSDAYESCFIKSVLVQSVTQVEVSRLLI